MEVFDMFEILVNGNVVAIVVESVVKLFVSTLINNLPVEMSIETRRYNPTPVVTETSAE
jgi:hypothetical protein